MVGGDFVIDIQLAFTGNIVGTSSKATTTITNEIFGIFPNKSIVFFPCKVFFLGDSTTFTCLSSFFKISAIMEANPTAESTITDDAVNNSNLENVDPAYAPTMPRINAKTLISLLSNT